jgi:hypothetical protein
MSASDATAVHTEYHGWDAIKLQNRLVTALAVPEIGGRLMEFTLGSQQFLFVNQELLGKRFTPAEYQGDGTLVHWKNFGGAKTWPAPQGWDNDQQWHGPPDPVLDSGVYSHDLALSHTGARVSMRSPADMRTGLRIQRTLSLLPGTSRLHIERRFENISDRPVRWAMWEVAQLACASRQGGFNTDCWVYAPADTWHIMFGDDNRQVQRHVRPGILGVHYQGIVGKIGIHNRAGWLAFADQQTGWVLCFHFGLDAGADYPDGGAVTEVWTESPRSPSPVPLASPGYLLEAEVLSPLFTIAPGASASHDIHMCAAFCPGPIVAVTEAGCTHVPLRYQVEAGWVRLSGVFGCFLQGQAALVWLDAAGQTIGSEPVGPASPLAVLHLDRIVGIPDGAAHLRLTLDNHAGGPPVILDEVACFA